ncbi:MAG: DUF4124 domain-containing protein [Methylobacter sp.]|nr:DUF4124 domain-containing protein [Methylobacter sp.]
MKILFFILLPLLSSSAQAEVFKCQLDSGKTAYQSTPCHPAAKQQTIEIETPDPREVAETKAKLKAWKEDFAKREQDRIKAEKDRQAELDRKASVEALRKSAEYQKQQAYEAKRQADAIEQQTRQLKYQQFQYLPSVPISPQTYPFYPSHLHHQHDNREKYPTDTQQSEQSGLKIRIKLGSDKGQSKFFLDGKPAN